MIQPELEWWPKEALDGMPVPEGFRYASDTNTQWLTPEQLQGMITDD